MALLLAPGRDRRLHAVTARWGYAWFTSVATPWLGSLVRLAPRVDLMANTARDLQGPRGERLRAPGARPLHPARPHLRRAPRVPVAPAPGGHLAAPPPGVARRLPRFPMSSRVLERWDVEDKAFWASEGRAIARRNLWISIPALLLSFAVWMVWSVVVVRLPEVGFPFTTDQLFWLAALPGPLRRDAAHLLLVHGAHLRRAEVDGHLHGVAPPPGGGHRLRRAGPDHLLRAPCWCWRSSAASAAATSPPAWRTSASSSPRSRRARRWG